MNWLDILPPDIKKIIDKKVQDIHIKERRIERKKNRAQNRLLKHKKDVRTKFSKIVKKLYDREQYKIKSLSRHYIQKRNQKERDDIWEKLQLIVGVYKQSSIGKYIFHYEIRSVIKDPCVRFTLQNGYQFVVRPHQVAHINFIKRGYRISY
jgi:hypothetical protein